MRNKSFERYFSKIIYLEFVFSPNTPNISILRLELNFISLRFLVEVLKYQTTLGVLQVQFSPEIKTIGNDPKKMRFQRTRDLKSLHLCYLMYVYV